MVQKWMIPKMDNSYKLKLLIHGTAGKWKTSMAKTCVNDERLMPMLLWNFEGGTDSIHSVCNYIDLSEIGKNYSLDKIDVVTIKSWKEFDKLIRIIHTKEYGYKTLFLDSISELTKLNLFEQSGAFESAKTSILSVRMPQLREYGESQEQLNVLVRILKYVDAHIICVSGSELNSNIEEGVTKKTMMIPALSGKLSLQLPHIFSHVGYMKTVQDSKQQNTIAMMFDNSSEYLAKTRDEFNRLGKGIINPTIPKILDKLTGG